MVSRDRRITDESGQAVAELVLVTPLLLLVGLLMICLGRVESAEGDVTSAARAAVQAAAVQPSPSQALLRATQAADETLTDSGLTCLDPQIGVNTAEFRPGGLVTVTVTCTTQLDDVLIPGIPGSRTMTSTEVASIDPYRVIS